MWFRSRIWLVIVWVLVLGGEFGERAGYSQESVQFLCEVLVKFKSADSSWSAGEVFQKNDVKEFREIPGIRVWKVECLEDTRQGLLAALRQDPMVEWAEPNGFFYATEIVPNDYFYQARQQNLRVIGAPLAWTFTTGGTGSIAVIDTGIDLDHPDLLEKIWKNTNEIEGNHLDDDGNGYIDDVWGWNFVARNANPQDDQSHGSHVAGIAAATTNNLIGIAGVSWQSSIMAVKALNNLGFGTWADVAEAIVYAAENGAGIINLSLGDKDNSQTVEDALVFARHKGCLILAATGNGGGVVEYPASSPNVLAVAATTNADLPASFSNRGPQVDLAAPGDKIFSLNNQGGYFESSGTSMAVPHVSGVAALVWSIKPGLTAVQVEKILKITAHDAWAPGFDDLTGWGRVDAGQAVSYTLELKQVYWPVVQRGMPVLPKFIYLPLILNPYR